jgi:hypothetical protein
VFWSVGTTSGEAHVVGYDAKDDRILIVAMGSIFTEIPVASCSPTGSSEPPLGQSYRRHYQKLFPGKLK